MNSTEQLQRHACGFRRLVLGSLLCGLVVAGAARATLGADATYQNDGIVNYPENIATPPQIDATNFINNSQFIINFTALQGTQPFYETSDTLNYTNRGLMMANTGFQFDNYSTSTGLRTMSSSFYNSGTVSCGSLNDVTTPGFPGFFGFPYEQCLVSATNILNPGVVDVGANGMIQLTGQNVDLTRARLTLEEAGANVAGSGVFGLNTGVVTNGNIIYFMDWDPSLFLGPTFAESALFPIQPIILFLPNSTAYFNFANPNTNTTVIRSVFIEDDSPSNVAYNVYFDTAGTGFGSGNVTIEWVGSYQDVAKATFHNNYLYLNDNYDLSASTNMVLINGYPSCFTFTSSTNKLIFQPPAPAGFVNVFPSGAVTNRYAFANVQIAAGSAATNQIANLSPTNLPGRVQINASSELNLAMAQINTPNYMSVQSTNQFDGSPGASIQVPYSDLNLGVTNGFLTISNLLTPNLPSMSGTVQAWSTRWLVGVTNTSITFSNGFPIATNTFTGTNDFRVLIVGSQLTPTTIAQVQNMLLHGTNSLVVSDALNVMRTFNADAQSLTLTTNGSGRGATSLDGEVNVAASAIFDWSSSLPNLRNLTNNGAIRLQNLTKFLGSSNTVAVTPPVAASAILSEVTNYANVLPLNKVIIGAIPYLLVSNLTNSVPNQVKIAGNFDGTMNNLIAAVNGGPGAGTGYSSSTVANSQASAGPLNAHAFTVTATTNGPAGNTVQAILSNPTTNYLVWIGALSNKLSGGMNAVTNAAMAPAPYRNFVNHGLVQVQGSQIWADNFESSGMITNGPGSFVLQSQNTAFTNALLYAGGDVSITTGNLLASNLTLEADRSLTLTATNFLTDTGVTNGNVWTVGAASVGEGGLDLPVLPATAVGGAAYGNSLLGTTINLMAPSTLNVMNTWAANDYGVSPAGFSNNVAIGHLVLDALAASPTAVFTFNGVGASNAIYVDRLDLRDYASYTNHDAGGNLPALAFNNNLVIYYADAVATGAGNVSVQLNHKNNNHLRWVAAYNGYFSSTNIIYLGTTNTFNIGLAQSSVIDSDGDGIANASDPTPFFLPAMLNFTDYPTNNPANNIVISWTTVPLATNYVYYSTNLAGPYNALLTNFISPQPYPGPATNVMVFDPMVTPPRYYQVMVSPWLTYPY